MCVRFDMISHTRYIKYDIGRCTINDITNKKEWGHML